MNPAGAPDDRTGAVTKLLRRWREGEVEATEELMQAVYPELHRLASGYLRRERQGHTLQPTALVHEAYLRLIDSDVDYSDRVHFLAIAARVMRRVLIDHAKARKSQKRGGDQLRVTLTEARLGAAATTPDVLALDASLRRLAEHDERKSRVIELRFFGGMTYDETAEALDISVATVNRELRFAKAWLANDMTDSTE